MYCFFGPWLNSILLCIINVMLGVVMKFCVCPGEDGCSVEVGNVEEGKGFSDSSVIILLCFSDYCVI